MSRPPTAEGAVAVLRLVGGLKRVERTGWLNHGVVDPESVSDHSHRMAVAALLANFPDSGVDATRYESAHARTGSAWSWKCPPPCTVWALRALC